MTTTDTEANWHKIKDALMDEIPASRFDAWKIGRAHV